MFRVDLFNGKCCSTPLLRFLPFLGTTIAYRVRFKKNMEFAVESQGRCKNKKIHKIVYYNINFSSFSFVLFLSGFYICVVISQFNVLTRDQGFREQLK